MLLKAEPLAKSVKKAKTWLGNDAKVIFVSPKGQRLSQPIINTLATESRLIFVAGRYEGVDQRFIDLYVDECYSLGDYVISGGELASMVMIDAIIRQIPGSLGDNTSALQDSFMQGILDCPHYTRPSMYEGLAVPEVLLSGDHQAIARWQRQMALGNTWRYRPDLFDKCTFSADDNALLNAFIEAFNHARDNERS